MYKFSSKSLAESFRNRLTKIALILLGDDGKFWVCFGATAEKLIKQGYQVAI